MLSTFLVDATRGKLMEAVELDPGGRRGRRGVRGAVLPPLLGAAGQEVPHGGGVVRSECVVRELSWVRPDEVEQGRFLPVFAAAVYDQNARLVEAGLAPVNLDSVILGAQLCSVFAWRLIVV